MKQQILGRLTSIAALIPALCSAQVNSGSNGSDGALDFSGVAYSTNIIIDMHDHSNGVYQYTYVNISGYVTVTFIPNSNNAPVTWLVQSNVVIDGVVDVSGQNESVNSPIGGLGGPGGWAGGSGGTIPSAGQGPGGGGAGYIGGGGSFGSLGSISPDGVPEGQTYGNSFLIPLTGGSGGGGGNNPELIGGGGGGGAILIAASKITLNGLIDSHGGGIGYYNAGGSGGGIRLLASNVTGTGQINTSGGQGNGGSPGGSGRIRLDAFQNNFGGQINGAFTQGFQPIIIPVAGQGVQLSIASVAGASVSPTPTGQLVTPDTIISGQQANPISIVVNCSNLPLNTPITVTVKPASGASVSAVGNNISGTLVSSTAIVSLNMPRGGGLIYATAATSN